MYYTYILIGKNNKKYIGHSHDIEDRLSRHNAGRERSTKANRLWNLVYKEECGTRSEAMVREKQLKSYKGGEALKKLIQSTEE